MKLDMGRAWNEATAMLSANKDVVSIVAAVFLFLPSLAFSVLAPTTEIEAIMASNPDAVQPALVAYFTDYWWLFLVYILASFVGTLALFALLGRRQKPTVGEAISLSFKALIPYILASLIVGIAAGLVFVLVSAATGLAGPFVGVPLGIVAVIFFVVVTVRVVLVGPVMTIEDTLNPIAALQRSWNLVKGNTRWVFLFVFMLMIAMLVLSMIIGLFIALAGAIFSGGAALWIEAIFGGLISAVMSVIVLAVYVAIYRQLSGGLSQNELETFE